MPKPASLPPELVGRAFDAATARAFGVSRGRTRASDLVSPFRGVRAPASTPADYKNRVRAYAARMPGDQFFSHESAAVVLGLPLPHAVRTDAALHVTTGPAARPPRMKGVIGHRPRGHKSITVVDGLRVTDPLQTWCDLSTRLPLDGLIAMGDALVRRQRPFATLDELRVKVAAHAGQAGAPLLRESLEWIRARTDSPRETEVRLVLVRAGLPEPEVNPKIFNRFGAEIGFADMFYRAQKVIVEYDGIHHFEGDQPLKDVERIEEFVEENHRVIRFNRTHLGRTAFMVRKVSAALRERGWEP